MRPSQDDAGTPAPDDPETGLVDPRSGPGGPGAPPMVPPSSDSNEAPDGDPPAWEGSEPGEPTPALIDPRPEIPSPPGL